MRNRYAAVLLLILIASLNTINTPETAAPPFGYGYTCGLISEYLSTDVQITHASLNATITIDSDGENLIYRFQVLSCYNLTNTADEEVSFVTSYVRSPWTPHPTYESIPDNVSIDGNSNLYNASIMYKLLTRAELPEVLQYRYPSPFFSSFSDSSIDVVNITMAAHAEVVLSIRTIFEELCYGDYFDFRFGLDIQKFDSDSARLDGTIEVSNSSILVRTDLLNSHSRSVTLVDDTLVASWSIADWAWGSTSTYPGMQIDDSDVFSDYIGAQLWQSEYLPPRPQWGDMALLFVPFVILVVIILVVWTRGQYR